MIKILSLKELLFWQHDFPVELQDLCSDSSTEAYYQLVTILSSPPYLQQLRDCFQ